MLHLQLLGPVAITGDAGGHDARGVLTQPKRLAVLAHLAAREAGEFVRRDTLLGTFWPEQSQSAARRSLRQTLHFLRSHLGAGLLLARGDDEIAVDPAVLESDVSRFLRDLGDGHAAEGLEWYRGDLLAGFYLSGATHAFEQWLEDERGRLRSRAAGAAAALAQRAKAAGDLGLAAAWERRVLQVAPDDEAALRRLLVILERSGEPSAALRVFDAFARRLSRELDYRPGAETTAIVMRLRAAAPAARALEPEAEAPLAPIVARAALAVPALVVPVAAVAPASAEAPIPAAEPAVLSAPTTSSRPGRLRRLRVAAPAALIVLVAAAGGRLLLVRHEARPVLAVGDVRDGDGAAGAAATRILPELLATDLARLRNEPGVAEGGTDGGGGADGAGDLAVIPPTRLEEIAGHLHSAGRQAAASDAALAAGATDLVEGVVYRLDDDSLRLDLRLVGTRSGVVRGALTVTGVDAFGLADSAAAQFADRFGLARPARPLADVTSSSPEAQALYLAGLRTYYGAGDDAAAARLFGDAVAADSTFAMAAYYLSRTLAEQDPQGSRDALTLAARMAGHAAPREALLIGVSWAQERGDPAWPALADSLAARWPDDPETRVLAGQGHAVSGDFSGAIADYREAIRLDALSLKGVAARCLACDAYESLIAAYVDEDSLARALAEARAWVAQQPRSTRAWNMYGVVLERREKLDASLQARATVDELLGHTDAGLGVSRGYFAIRSGDLAAAESLLVGPAEDGHDPQHGEAEWWYVLALRTAGRPTEAIGWARRIAAEDRKAGGRFNEASLAAMPEGQALFEAGRLDEAARVFGSSGLHSAAFRIARPGSAGRDRAWALAQRAAVAAAQRDTIALGWLADSVAAAASASAFGRDRRLASWVRGLRLEVTGHAAAAVDTFRNAVYTPTEGYTRVNLEAARALLALGRPAEAVAWVQEALRGGLEASNYYVTRTELEELAGQGFAALGRRDSAAAHYAWVVRAWSDAEPPFHARWQAARDYVAAAGRRIALAPPKARRARS